MAQGYSVSIGVVDNATKHIDAINKQLAAMQAPMLKLNKSISKFADLTGIKAVENGVKNIVSRVGSLVLSLNRALPLLGILTGAASIAGVYRLAEGFAEMGQRLRNTAIIVGTSASQLQLLQNGARLAGVSADDMTQSIEGLGQVMQDALVGKNTDAAALFKLWGVNIQAAGYQAKSGADKLDDAFSIIQKMSKAGASTATLRHAMGIMGLSEGLLPYAIQGRDGLEKYNAEAKRFGVVSQDQVKGAVELQHSIREVQLASEGLTNSIVSNLSPVLSPLLDQFANWIAKNRELIAGKIKEYVQQFADYIKSIDWKQVSDGIGHFFDDVKRVTDALGGWKQASEILIGLWTGSKVIAMLANIAAVTRIMSIPGVMALLAGWATKKEVDGYVATAQKAEQLGYTESGWDANGVGNAWRDKDGKTVYGPEIDRRYQESGYGNRNAGEGWKSNADLNKSRQEAYDFWIKNGLNPNAAAAMVAQEEAESSFSPGARGDNGTAGGSFQWHADRRNTILSNTGIDVWKEKDPQKQREAALWELHHTYQKALRDMQAAKTARESGAVGSSEYEIPADREGEEVKRGKIAERIARLNGASSSAAAPTPAATPTGGTLDVTIKHVNPPPGSTVTATAQGYAVNGAPRIVQPLSPALGP